ncbi:MAG: hypothetical protein ACJASM_002968 [Salibacteraceae bacterium]|jgi:hypothetical protein
MNISFKVIKIQELFLRKVRIVIFITKILNFVYILEMN